jgi:hypothetical protein
MNHDAATNIFLKNEGIYGAAWSPLNDSRGIFTSRLVTYEGIYGGTRGHLWRGKGIYGENRRSFDGCVAAARIFLRR